MGTLTKAIIFFKECQLIVSRQHKAPRQETLKHEIRTFDQLRQTPQTNSNAVTSIKIPTSEKREIAKKHFLQKYRKTSFKTDSNDGFTRTAPSFLSRCGESSNGSVWLEKLPNTNGYIKIKGEVEQTKGNRVGQQGGYSVSSKKLTTHPPTP